MTEKSSSRLVGIDILRGLAAAAVVLTHLPFSLSSGTAQESATSVYPAFVDRVLWYGQVGVHLFLVLSGFCIHMQWARQADDRINFVPFWKRRLKRLYPPYFVALLAALGGLYLLSRATGGSGAGLGGRFGYASTGPFLLDVVLLLLLAQNLNGASHRVGNGPFWSLALEEQLYMLYFPLIFLRRKYGWGVTLAVTALCTFAWRACFAWSADTPVFAYVVGPARWLEWTLGALAVEAHLGRTKLPRLASSPLVALAVFALAVVVTPGPIWTTPGPAQLVRDLLFSGGCFFLVNWICKLDRAGVFAKGRIWQGLTSLGVMSYSLYLVHYPAMGITKRVAVRLGITSVPLLTGIRLGAAFAAGIVFFLIVERRFLNKRPAQLAVGLSPVTAASSTR